MKKFTAKIGSFLILFSLINMHPIFASSSDRSSGFSAKNSILQAMILGGAEMEGIRMMLENPSTGVKETINLRNDLGQTALDLIPDSSSDLYQLIESFGGKRSVDLLLLDAVKRGDSSETSTLLKKGANPDIIDENGDTPLHIIAQYQHSSMLHIFYSIERLPSEDFFGDVGSRSSKIFSRFNQLNKVGETPLEVAMKSSGGVDRAVYEFLRFGGKLSLMSKKSATSQKLIRKELVKEELELKSVDVDVDVDEGKGEDEDEDEGEEEEEEEDTFQLSDDHLVKFDPPFATPVRGLDPFRTKRRVKRLETSTSFHSRLLAIPRDGKEDPLHSSKLATEPASLKQALEQISAELETIEKNVNTSVVVVDQKRCISKKSAASFGKETIRLRMDLLKVEQSLIEQMGDEQESSEVLSVLDAEKEKIQFKIKKIKTHLKNMPKIDLAI